MVHGRRQRPLPIQIKVISNGQTFQPEALIEISFEILRGGTMLSVL
jgi:hypothetical protein